MKGLGRRASFLAIVAVFATALMGAAYTLWYEDLTLHAEVAAGELDGQIICGTQSDNDDSSNPANTTSAGYPDPNPGNLVVKDIGEIDFSGPDANAPDPEQAWIITVSNAYPGYALDCEIELYNTGSVIWHVETQIIEVSSTDDPAGNYSGNPCPVTNNNCTAGNIGTPPNPFDPQYPPIFVRLGDARGCQIHPGDPTTKSLIIGVNQSAKENATYHILVKYQINQWNESNWYGCDVDNPNRPGPVVPQ